MALYNEIQNLGKKVVSELLNTDNLPPMAWSRTRKEFEGEFTLVVFPLLKSFGKKPEEVGNIIGEAMVGSSDLIQGYNVVKGFLNLEVNDRAWARELQRIETVEDYGRTQSAQPKTVVVEFSSPNTNKPLHLGHIRNILLGWSVSNLLQETGHNVIKTQIINDRGIAICKSMLAWKKYGNEETPESTGIKGDHFVGHYYVEFEKRFQEEYGLWQKSEIASQTFEEFGKDGESNAEFFKRWKNEYFNRFSSLGQEAREMLQKWEAGDAETKRLWKTMNGWVYNGFDVSYETLGVEFDHIYYESETYLKGKEMVEEGLMQGLFYTKDDGSVWVDLEDAGMDQKIILRSDGTAVYITQDLGTAELRYEDHKMDSGIYVVADEQDYHFQVLFEVLKRLNRPYAPGLNHLSYGMVDLPSGKMKSREGTVVDADDLTKEVIEMAKEGAAERGELSGLNEDEKEEIFHSVGLGALKFYILKVQPKRRMTFNPEESVDMQGQTGPYIQNAYVRIQSVLRKSDDDIAHISHDYSLSSLEKELVIQLMEFPEVIKEAADKMEPSHLANYLYNLSKEYHRFYHEHRILTAETEEAKSFRLLLSSQVARILKRGMKLLGINMPKRM